MNVTDDDLFDPRPDGTIRLRIGGTEQVLRRPKIGEFRMLRERLADVTAHTVEQIAEAAEAIGEHRAPAAIAERAEAQAASDARAEALARSASIEADLLTWWRSVYDLLGTNDSTLPANPDDYPTWFLGDGIVNECLQHWRLVPRRPGG